MTNKELQDALNGRLEKFDGEKYTGKEACTPVYHRWYMHEIESELESRGIEISGPLPGKSSPRSTAPAICA